MDEMLAYATAGEERDAAWRALAHDLRMRTPLTGTAPGSFGRPDRRTWLRRSIRDVGRPLVLGSSR
mgnify:CR=1 FL=1